MFAFLYVCSLILMDVVSISTYISTLNLFGVL